MRVGRQISVAWGRRTKTSVMDHGVMQHPIRTRMRVVRQMLNEWDFIGVGKFYTGDDEYDCLLGPLLARFASGANVDDVVGFLREEIEGHFGLELTDTEIATFAVRTVAWWQDEESRSTA